MSGPPSFLPPDCAVNSMDLAGGALALGALCFLVGAANPRVFRVWTSGQDIQFRVIHAHRRSWQATNQLFAIATVLTAAGLTLIPDLVGPGGADLARIAVAAYDFGAVLWLASLAFRLVVTPIAAAEFARSGAAEAGYTVVSRWSDGLFAIFTVVTGSSLAILGIAIVAGGVLPALVGWLSILLGVVIAGGYIAAGDMPPFVAYLPTGVLGIAMLLAGT